MAESDFFATLLEKRYESVETDTAGISPMLITSAFDHIIPDIYDSSWGIDTAELLHLLRPHKFQFESRCLISQTLILFRPSFAPDLYESLSIQAAGQRSHVIQARVGVWYGRHGIVTGQSRLLAELAPTSRTGILMLRTADAARRAEERIATVAPHAAESFARGHGMYLLTRLARIRPQVDAYLQHMRPLHDPARLLSRLLSLASPDHLDFSRRLLESPGVQRIPAPTLYRAASLALAIFGEQVENLQHPFRSPTLRGAPTILRLQLLVHHLLECL